MDYIFNRNINYYETDKMGVVHHSNYIRFLEEARCEWLKSMDMPFEELEKNGITVPVLNVNITYKMHVTFGDTISIRPFVKEYTGVRMTVGYEVINAKTKDTVIIAETKHCFTDLNLKPINLKKYKKDYSEKLEEMNQKNKVDNNI